MIASLERILKDKLNSKEKLENIKVDIKNIKETNKCDVCKGTGWVVTDNNTYKACKCVNKERIEKMWANSGISLSDMNKTFKGFDNWNDEITIMKQIAIQYFKSFDTIKDTKENSILLSGNPGCGKTHLLLALAHNFIDKKNIDTIYMAYRDEITSIKQSMLNEDKYIIRLKKFKEAGLLLIDDLFKGKITESDINIMFEIINYRYLNNLPMMISTELNTTKILDIDEGLGSRILEMCCKNMKEIIGRENNFRLRKFQ